MGTDPSVFISYARADKNVAAGIAERLRAGGVSVWWDAQLGPGQDYAAVIQDRLRAADYVILLLSQSALESRWVMSDMSEALREYNDRAVTVLPVLLDDLQLPPSLSQLQFLDLRHDVQRGVEALALRISASVDANLSDLNEQAFENLLADLLFELGFGVERNWQERSVQFDFKASLPVRDPFGALVNETWFIEAKHHRSGRLSVEVIRSFIGMTSVVLQSQPNTKVALITSGQITSAGREVLMSHPLRVIEGVELKRILITRPHLLARHLGRI